jgi:4-amino-4-deoxy-L-arabinose transferase-like glycosyltransferase
MYGHLSNATVLILPTVAALFPWAGLLPQALWRVSLRNKGPREILRMTMCVSAVTALTFYSLSSSKLPSYALVAVPPLGILIGLWLDDDIDASKPSRTGWIQTTTLLGVVATVLLSAPLWVGALVTARQLFGAVRPQQSDVAALLAPITFPLGGLFAAAAIALLWFKRPAGRVIAVATLGALAPVVLLFCGQPILRSMYPWEALSAKVEPGHGHIWLVGRRAPSLTFYAHQPVSTIASIESLERVVQWEHEGWIALTREDWAQFATTEPATEAHATLVAEGGRIVLARFRH